jgi:hypothetical protein
MKNVCYLSALVLMIKCTILCTYVIEEGRDGEGDSSESPSLLSYTLRCVSLEELGHVWVPRTDAPE